jgi:hypothetical protein
MFSFNEINNRIWQFVLIFFFLFSFRIFSIKAQTFELGATLGASLYQGDLSEDNVNFKGAAPAYGAFVRYNIDDRFSVSGNFNAGKLNGSDANSSDPGIRKRGFELKSNIKELAFFCEFNLIPTDKRSHRYGFLMQRFSPYVFAGVALATTDGTPTAPADRIPYPFPEKGTRDTFIAIPFGLGLKIQVSEEINTGFDFGWRPTLSDYLDGVSVNGNPNRNDWYFFTGIKISYLLDFKNR